MKIFDLEITPAQLAEMTQAAEEAYPKEACGVGLGAPGPGPLRRVAPIDNVQDRYHLLDSAEFPRDARTAFRMDELERLRVLEQAEAEGLVERLVFHSHPDTGAYFSAEDRAMAVYEGTELVPGAVHLVISVREGRAEDAAAFRFVPEGGGFAEARVPLRTPESGPPDLELRAMEGGEAQRPISPVGGRLLPRLVTEIERAELSANATHRVAVDDDIAVLVELFGRGLLSPLSGFMRRGEVDSVEARGRLLSGADWRAPIRLELRGLDPELDSGALVELVDRSGEAIALLAVEEVDRKHGKALLGGPLFVYQLAGESAVDTRAEILRSGARMILAIPADAVGVPAMGWDGFDGLLAPRALAESPEIPVWNAPKALDSTWLGAVIAQNLGATHIWLEDPSSARAVADTLEIQVLRSGDSGPLDPS